MKRQQHTKDGKPATHQDHFRCTITRGYCGKRRHYEDECHIKKRESDKLKRQEAERQKTQTPTRNPPNWDKGGKGGGKGGDKNGPPNPRGRSSAPVATPTPAATPAPAVGDPKKRPQGDNATPEEGQGATGRQRGEGAVVGKGEGREKEGHVEAGKGGAEGVAARAEEQGEGQGQRAAEGPGADPFNVVDVRAGMDMRRREWRSQRESVIADILEVSEDEGEGAGRMAVEGGPGQPSAPNVPAAAMKYILLEVRRQEEGKGGRGQLEGLDKGGKGQAGTSGAVHAKGHLAGKGGKGSGRGRQWPQPQRRSPNARSGSCSRGRPQGSVRR